MGREEGGMDGQDMTVVAGNVLEARGKRPGWPK